MGSIETEYPELLAPSRREGCTHDNYTIEKTENWECWHCNDCKYVRSRSMLVFAEKKVREKADLIDSTFKQGDFIYYGHDVTKQPDYETDPYVKFNNKGKFIASRGTPFEIKTIIDRIKEEKEFPFNKIKKKRKALENPVKTNKLRRSRGYSFEHKVVTTTNEFDQNYYTYARRLGGSSTGFPDILITSHAVSKTIVAMECKSGKDTNILDIPADEVFRCEDILDMFDAYQNKLICFAFRFAKSEKYKRTKPEERYWLSNSFASYFRGKKLDLQKIRFNIMTGNLDIYDKTWGITCTVVGSKANGCYSSLHEFIQKVREL